ncbi:heavy-metal-associated domain-containing protein [Rhodoferax sp.]|uniref:heavy-metal-associated domain-containing protein n=1 Tax=Rhodoferax sp. TaxID=50421 RepID=UPI00272EFA4B|nr:heavy-metal-associated domain-containing protein [Rhodoferax sp.]MDP1531209.1 heavy-metal-associated domain-containing protein [Rhodoferax sp.]MDP1942259.1 heavy-metal-associated domain-containing protein [Rhodoferax sp.]MDP2441279.1 heavy-metal-associated domain-containing protein [Rhodoferax sp.]MDZ4207936.1 heavy-metal-associated domain-containing protein [Rhodoferax sp.]
MHEFHIPDMTCGHCASKVNASLKLVDPACEIHLDLPRHMVNVKSEEDRDTLVEALAEAGYPSR